MSEYYGVFLFFMSVVLGSLMTSSKGLESVAYGVCAGLFAIASAIYFAGTQKK